MSTIAAVSTPLAASGLGVIRVSGEDALCVGCGMFRAQAPGGEISHMPGYTCAFGRVYDGEGDIDECVATVFRAPRSYTGEDTVEFSCHGGPVVLKRVLRAAFALGASPAEPGEFTKRAFLNGKMTLTQAEAVMDIISARSEEAGKAALAMKDGAMYKKISAVMSALSDLQSHFAAWADFPEEDVPELTPDSMKYRLLQSESALRQLLGDCDMGMVMRNGVSTVIVGKPNVGKSTLMNLLAGCRRSIVTDVAGTTRDIVEDSVLIDGIPLRLMDTAGLRSTDDPVERIGVDIAEDALQSCDVAIAVFDSSAPLDEDDRRLIRLLEHRPAVAVVNKSDLPPAADIAYIEERIPDCVRLSAADGSGLGEFKAALGAVLDIITTDITAPLMANERQTDCVRRAASAVDEALGALACGMTLDAVSICVEAALDALYELTGQRASDAVIDGVFSKFCVGK